MRASGVTKKCAWSPARLSKLEKVAQIQIKMLAKWRGPSRFMIYVSAHFSLGLRRKSSFG